MQVRQPTTAAASVSLHVNQDDLRHQIGAGPMAFTETWLEEQVTAKAGPYGGRCSVGQ